MCRGRRLIWQSRVGLQPHAPLSALPELVRFDRLSVADRLAELDLTEEEHDVLVAELESRDVPLGTDTVPCSYAP